MGLTLLILFWALMAASIALPVYGGWRGYRRKPQAWGLACCAYLIGIVLLWVLYGFLDNSEELRAAFGSETHQGIGMGVHLLTWYIAGPAVVGSIVTYGLGWLLAKKRRSRSPN